MTDKKYDFEHLEEGDTFEGGPLEQSTFISELQAAGGEFELKGNKVIIKKLAKKEESKAKAVSSSKKAEAPKKEAPKAEEKKEAPKAEEKKEASKAETSKHTSDDKNKE